MGQSRVKDWSCGTHQSQRLVNRSELKTSEQARELWDRPELKTSEQVRELWERSELETGAVGQTRVKDW